MIIIFLCSILVYILKINIFLNLEMRLTRIRSFVLFFKRIGDEIFIFRL